MTNHSSVSSVPRRHAHDVARRACRPWALSLALTAAAVLTSLFLASPASALPAFARKYETTCQTCHLVYPKLTPFGEAFRRNGYRFPQGGDEVMVKREPVAMGHEAQADLWPDAVYPGTIPHELPLSVAAQLSAKLGKHFETHGASEGGDGHGGGSEESGEKLELDFGELGASARLLSGATFGEVSSFFMSISFGEHEAVEVERLALSFYPLEPQHLQIKAGRFEPDLHGISIHRGVLGHQLRFTSARPMLSQFAIEPYIHAIQLSGILAGRAGWTVGVAQNTAPVEGINKDVYFRAEGKLGGMRLDGIDSEAESKAWREKSVTWGVSGYRGLSLVTASTGVPHTDEILRAGADVHVVMDDLMVDLAVARQWHGAPGEDRNDSRVLTLAYAEVTYVTLPWLFPSLRYEGSFLTGAPDGHRETGWLGLAGVNCLLRPNLVLRTDTGVGADPGGHAGFRYVALSAVVAL